MNHMLTFPLDFLFEFVNYREVSLTKMIRGPVVQRLEPSAHNGAVVGSSPTGPTIFYSVSIYPFKTL